MRKEKGRNRERHTQREAKHDRDRKKGRNRWRDASWPLGEEEDFLLQVAT